MLRTLTALAILTLTASIALADTEASINVPFGDLNLSQAQDARILAERLQTAAERVCLKTNESELTNDRIGQYALKECVDTAISIAMGRIEASLERKVRTNLVSARQFQPSH